MRVAVVFENRLPLASWRFIQRHSSHTKNVLAYSLSFLSLVFSWARNFYAIVTVSCFKDLPVDLAFLLHPRNRGTNTTSFVFLRSLYHLRTVYSFLIVTSFYVVFDVCQGLFYGPQKEKIPTSKSVSSFFVMVC